MIRVPVRLALVGSLSLIVGAVGVACSPGSTTDLSDEGGSLPSKTTHDASSTSDDAVSSTTGTGFMSGSTGAGQGTCDAGPDEDKDQDGWTITQGDCNDCDKNVNPGAIEVIVTEPDPMTGMVPDPADEDCDNVVDNAPMPCDAGLALDSTNPEDAAKAIELCKMSSGPTDWGVTSVNYVRANGTPWNNDDLQHGILDNFGPNVLPQKGGKLLMLSSGNARIGGDANACADDSCSWSDGAAPPNFPQDVPDCPGHTDIHDDVALEVHLKAPSNATGYSFDFKFTSWEFPEYVCTPYNDQFIALVDPAPPGSINGNISFDTNSNPVSVNVAFFDVCGGCANFGEYCPLYGGTCPAVPVPCCPAGASELVGTNFDTYPYNEAGGTVWLRTSAPVTPGDSFSVRFAIWDTGDHALDSTTVIDNFEWIANGGTVVVGTTPPPQ